MSSTETLCLTARTLNREVEPLLVRHCKDINRAQPVLDLRAGKGANSFYLADRGFRVDALEDAREVYNELKAKADDTTLTVQVVNADFADFRPQINVYAGILVLDLIPELSRQEIMLLHQKLLGWTMAGSLIWVSGLTVSDPSYEISARHWRKVGRNSFTNGRGKFRSYLEPGEIIEIFEEYRPLEHFEGEGEEMSDGNGGSYRSHIFKAAFRR